MEGQSPDYKELFLKEQQRRCEEQQRRQEAERAQQEAERAQRKTNLPEFLDACHTRLHLGLNVQTDMKLSTQGDPSNANDKVRPKRFRWWTEFPDQQEAIWKSLIKSDFVHERRFPTKITLQENGEMIRKRQMGSELDLHHFERATAEDPVSSIISEMYDNSALRKVFNLEGSVRFENHSNTLSPDEELQEGLQQMTVSGITRRRSPRLAAKGSSTGDPTSATSSTSAGTAKRTAYPRADQFCVYNMSTGVRHADVRIPVFVVEYKPPHKLSSGHIYEGLSEIDLDKLLSYKDTDGTKEHCQRLVAAAVTQAFSYMIRAGLEFGCVRNGEASIFLQIPETDPSIVQYFLSVPKGDVGESTGWHESDHSTNRLHLTSVGQLLAFTLRTLKTRPRANAWRTWALEQLPIWEMDYGVLLEAIPTEDLPSSEYRPPPMNNFVRMSPIQLRHRRTRRRSSCNDDAQTSAIESEDDDPDSETPSRSRRPQVSPPMPKPAEASSTSIAHGVPTQTKDQQFCTHKCLLGLMARSSFDESCPNAPKHGQGRHSIDGRQFLKLMLSQLSRSVDVDFEPIGRPGSRGVPFKAVLRSYGYTVVAKCVPMCFASHLSHEGAVYRRLHLIQGRHIPVNLGIIPIPHRYFYEGITELTHAMFMSYAGTPIDRHFTSINREQVKDQAVKCFEAIHKSGVIQNDAAPRNVLRDAITGGAMVIDFERAQILPTRTALGTISPNRKRNRDHACLARKKVDVFARERNKFVSELNFSRFNVVG
ncbi:hypothetical protein LTS18_014509 [Coniosporium uncinatum]|uniref:Uncharacterized protein n=1 Tax=Coniosporium uncinatum TaxID=93489 RepID=A0ACC3DVE1_9PEZI|nr:hypothetical protein LTS18_014509 [Coniosporium uncinatum]